MEIGGRTVDDQALAGFCRRHGVARLSLFGSVLRGDDRPESDIDLLVEFIGGQSPSLLDLGGMLMELQNLLGRPVDLKTPAFLSPHIRQDVLKRARPLYAA